MDNQRKHELQQQQLQRKQEVLHFQKRQEQLRLQQQQGYSQNPQQLSKDQLINQQHSQKQKQEHFLRNYKRSSALNGATVVNISPEVYVRMSASPTCEATEWTYNQIGAKVQGVPLGVLTEMPVSNIYLTPNGHSQAKFTNNAHPPVGAGSSTPHNSADIAVYTPASTSEPSQITIVPDQPVEPPNNTIALKDGSIIILKAEDEILFRGPNGVEMIVNCLPLYEPPPMTSEVTDAGSLRHNVKISIEEHSPNLIKAEEDITDGPTKRTFSLIKARSELALDSVTAELELHDSDCIVHRSEESILRTPVALSSSKWLSSFTRSVGVIVHNSFDRALIIARSDSHFDLVDGGNNPRRSVSENDLSRKGVGEMGSPEIGNEAYISFKAKAEANSHSNGYLSKNKSGTGYETIQAERSQMKLPLANGILSATAKPMPGRVDSDPVTHKKKLKASLSEPHTAFDDNGSDDDSDTQDLQVNYVDSSTMLTLPRASGSVSFFNRLQSTSSDVDKQSSNGVISKETDSAPVKAKSPNSLLATSNLSELLLQATPQQQFTTVLLIPSPLPVPPSTLDPSYIERSGWMNKLSHRRGMFGDKWQKRYFVLHRSWLYYFKKYGDSNPRGVVRLLPGTWCQHVAQGASRMADAVSKNGSTPRIISVLRCLAVHRPNNFAASLCDLLGTAGVAETFNRQTISMTNSQNLSRTYYMVAPSDAERDNWVGSITKNIQAYSHSSEALTNACKELKIMLRAVYSTIAPKHIPALLFLLHSKNKSLFHSPSQPQNNGYH